MWVGCSSIKEWIPRYHAGAWEICLSKMFSHFVVDREEDERRIKSLMILIARKLVERTNIEWIYTSIKTTITTLTSKARELFGRSFILSKQPLSRGLWTTQEVNWRRQIARTRGISLLFYVVPAISVLVPHRCRTRTLSHPGRWRTWQRCSSRWSPRIPAIAR